MNNTQKAHKMHMYNTQKAHKMHVWHIIDDR